MKLLSAANRTFSQAKYSFSQAPQNSYTRLLDMATTDYVGTSSIMPAPAAVLAMTSEKEVAATLTYHFSKVPWELQYSTYYELQRFTAILNLDFDGVRNERTASEVMHTLSGQVAFRLAEEVITKKLIWDVEEYQSENGNTLFHGVYSHCGLPLVESEPMSRISSVARLPVAKTVL